MVVEARMNRLAKNLKHMLELVENLEKRNVHIVSLDYNFDTRIYIITKALVNYYKGSSCYT
ncbi:recombinase family protein [Bacillus toyonensis]|nr:recombinase family protein [Bacillus toyonensis]